MLKSRGGTQNYCFLPFPEAVDVFEGLRSLAEKQWLKDFKGFSLAETDKHLK